MRTLLLSLAAGIAIAPLSALADDQTPPEQPAATAQNTNRVTCYYSYYEGSLIKQPSCQTERERLRRRLEEQDAIREIQRRALTHEL